MFAALKAFVQRHPPPASSPDFGTIIRVPHLSRLASFGLCATNSHLPSDNCHYFAQAARKATCPGS